MTPSELSTIGFWLLVVLSIVVIVSIRLALKDFDRQNRSNEELYEDYLDGTPSCNRLEDKRNTIRREE